MEFQVVTMHERRRVPQSSAIRGSAERPDSARAPVRAAIDAELRSGLHPRPPGRVALIAAPLLAMKDARRRRDVEVSFGLRHASGAGVPLDLQDVGRAFAVLAVGPWARQLAVIVAMRPAFFHCR